MIYHVKLMTLMIHISQTKENNFYDRIITLWNWEKNGRHFM